MDSLLKFITMTGAAIGAWFSNTPEVVKILLLVMMLDIIAGSIKAALIDKNLSASVAWSGVFKKAMTLIVVAVTFIVGGLIVGDSLSLSIGQSITAFFIYAEVVSVLQNAALVGIPIPDFLKNALDSINPDKSRPVG